MKHHLMQVVDVRLDQRELGFTLVEMLVGMAMGLVILAGLTTMFVSMNDASRAVMSRTERMGDIYLVSHLMQSELRGSQAICWDATNSRVIYQPIDSAVALGACDTVDAANGSFEMRAASSSKPTPYICWDRPDLSGGCQEMIRDLDSSGLTATVSVDGDWTVSLLARYINEEKQSKTLSLRFNTWPRN